MSTERLVTAWSNVCEERKDDEGRALIAEDPDAAAVSLVQIARLPYGVQYYIISDHLRKIRDRDLQATIAEFAIRYGDIRDYLVRLLVNLGCTVPLLNLALRVSRQVAIAYVYKSFSHFDDNQDCIDWVIKHLGDVRHLMLELAISDTSGSIILWDPDLLRDMPNWSYSTRNRRTIGNVIIHGYIRKLSIDTLKLVPDLLQYRSEAKLDKFIKTRRIVGLKRSVPLWLIELLDCDLAPLELVNLTTNATNSIYLARRGPEYATEYAFYYHHLV
jgi:hypothetical protein